MASVHSAVEQVVRAVERKIMLRWISDEMPSDNTEVLATIESEGKRRVCIAWTIQGRWRGLLSNEKVVAWMPMPEPWKESEDGD